MKNTVGSIYNFNVGKVEGVEMNNKIEKFKEMLGESGICPCAKKEVKKTNPLVIVFAVLGVIASVAAIAYAVFYFMMPEDSEYFEDFDEDDFEDEEDIED